MGFALPLRSVTRYRTAYLALIGGLIFLSIFYWRYSGIPDHLYEARDDGVITMSHGRNLVEYGFIGVNPSGEKVEGTTAPVQMFVYAAAYAATGAGYATFAGAQTLVCAFLLGTLFILFFRDRPLWAVPVTALSALALTYYTPFFLWHGSGTENAITHVLFAATVLALFWFVKTGRVRYELSVVVFLATVSRLDSIFHIAPVLVVFSVLWFLAYRDRRGLYFSGIVLALWVAFNLWRAVYFGDLVSNTAYAQGVAPGIDLRHASLAYYILAAHGALLLAVVSPMLIAVTFLRDREWPGTLLFFLIGILAVAAAITPLVFGAARLDPARTTTHLAVFTVLGMALIVYYGLIPRSMPPMGLLAGRRFVAALPTRRLLGVAAAMLVITVAVILFGYANPDYSRPTAITNNPFTSWLSYVEPSYLCCSVSWFDHNRRQFVKLLDEESLPRPTVSNPDLGVVSWHKQFNIVDLGELGTPILAKASVPLISDYFFDFAAPDILETHGWWSCKYADTVLTDPRFETAYMPVTAETTHREKGCRGHPQLQRGIWIRKDILKDSGSPERKLIDDLRADLSPARLRGELQACQAAPENLCTYVARTAYRFLPEFREQGSIDELNSVFAESRTRGFDLYLINGYRDGQIHRAAMESVALYRTRGN